MTKVVFEEKYYPAVKEMVYRTRLANGLTVALLPKKEFKEVYGSVTVQFGSVDMLVIEVDGDVKEYPAGIAHFLEHKLFEREDSSDLMLPIHQVNLNFLKNDPLPKKDSLFL